MPNELKRCPFCGGEPFHSGAMGEEWISCADCRCSTALASNAKAAWAKWNTRKDTTLALLDEVERLRAQVPQWVACAERMPAVGGEYLCGSTKTGSVWANYCGGREDGKMHWGEMRGGPVTHWMPLPSPPAATRGEGDEK